MKKIFNNLKIRNPETGNFESMPGIVNEYPKITYSEGEQFTGDHWIDGKPIYRYTWTGTATHSNAQIVMFTLPEIPETVISIKGMFQRDDTTWLTIPNIYYGGVDWAVNARTDVNGEVLLGFGAKYSGTRNVILFVEYTKKDN